MLLNIDFSKIDLQDALDIAIQIEKEAEERYAHFAEMLGASTLENSASELFLTMKRNEIKHGAELRKKRESLFGTAASNIQADSIVDVEAPEYSSPRIQMSTFQAMHIARDSEIKAAEFFTEALKVVKDKKVIELFEHLRTEEFEHRAILEKWIAEYQGDKESDLNDNSDEPPGL